MNFNFKNATDLTWFNLIFGHQPTVIEFVNIMILKVKENKKYCEVRE